jgi:hypothetical protein
MPEQKEELNIGLLHDTLTKATGTAQIAIPPVPTPAPAPVVTPYYTAIVLQNASTVLPDPTTTDWDAYFNDNVAATPTHPLKVKYPTVAGEIIGLSQDDKQYRMAFDVAQPVSITARLTVNGGGAGSSQQIKLNGATIHKHNTAIGTRETFTLTLNLIKGRNLLYVGFGAGNAGNMFEAQVLGPGSFVSS